MTKVQRLFVSVVLVVTLAAGAWGLMQSGLYGLTLFVAAPVMIGALAVWIFQPKTTSEAAWMGAIAPSLAMLALLLVKVEGIICIVMAIPLTGPLGLCGGLLAFHLIRTREVRGGAVTLVLLPSFGLLWDFNAQPPVFKVQSQLEIAAPPQEVWKHVIAFDELPEPKEWLFRSGIAYPKRARIDGRGAGAVRYCDFSTGPFVEPIEVWDAPRLLQFRVTENPAPMEEWNPFAKITPKHLHGYFVSQKGQFLLRALPGNRTLLEGTTWYRHGLWPAQYWRWWSDAIIHRIHLRVLRHIRTLAEETGV
jgi:hypothetical protein